LKPGTAKLKAKAKYKGPERRNVVGHRANGRWLKKLKDSGQDIEVYKT
jgi:hypothetical protein